MFYFILIKQPITWLYNYRKIYPSAVVLFNIANVMFEIEVSNHNTSGLVCLNSQITFDGDSIFLNNSGGDIVETLFYGGDIVLYESSRLLLNEHTNKTLNMSFFNNFASVTGGGIFVSQKLDLKKH